MAPRKAISDLPHAAKATPVAIRGLCCHGSWSYMAENHRISCQHIQHANATFKIAGNEAHIGSMASFLLQWVSIFVCNPTVLYMPLLQHPILIILEYHSI